MAFADDLLKDTHHLATRGGNNPKQSTLRRTVSTAYYALFHLLIGDFTSNWRVKGECARLGRMFEHRKMSGAVLKPQDKNHPTPLLAELKKVISAFTQLQEDRYRADYDVGWIWSRTDITNTLAVADEAFKTWRSIRGEMLAQHHLM